MSKAAAKEVVAASLPVHEAVLQAHQSVVTSLTARIRQRRVEERQQVRKRKGWKGKGRKGKERKELQQHRVTGRQQVRQRLGMRDAEQEACYVSYGYGSPPVHAPVLWSTSSAMAHPAILPSPLVPISLNTALHVGIVGVNT
eukprot:scaffold105036_cov20-Tisochrysis_lutea.AAC.2